MYFAWAQWALALGIGEEPLQRRQIDEPSLADLTGSDAAFDAPPTEGGLRKAAHLDDRAPSPKANVLPRAAHDADALRLNV